jgi:hypothetical protein
MSTSSRSLSQALLALSVAAACGSAPSTVATNSASASRIESSPAITVLVDNFGLVINMVFDF